MASTEALMVDAASDRLVSTPAIDSHVNSEAEAHSLARYPLARCLDGSPARYYLSKGDPSRVFVFFEGGSFYQDFAACQARAGTRLAGVNSARPIRHDVKLPPKVRKRSRISISNQM